MSIWRPQDTHRDLMVPVGREIVTPAQVERDVAESLAAMRRAGESTDERAARVAAEDAAWAAKDQVRRERQAREREAERERQARLDAEEARLDAAVARIQAMSLDERRDRWLAQGAAERDGRLWIDGGYGEIRLDPDLTGNATLGISLVSSLLREGDDSL